MQAQELRFSGAGDLPLFARQWDPKGNPRATVLITHGHGEHSGRYVHVGRALAEKGFYVIAMDLRGHGESGGARGFVSEWGEFRSDLDALIQYVDPPIREVPRFLYGHSVGGTISLDYALRRPEELRGVITSAPALGQPNIPAILFLISKVLSKIIPGFSLATQLDQTALSRDPQVVQAYRDDPLVHSTGTARLGTELLKTAEWIQENAPRLELPLLIIHGAQDRLMDPADSHRFYNNVGSTDKTLLNDPEGFHEPHNDLDREAVIKRVGDWLEAHLE